MYYLGNILWFRWRGMPIMWGVHPGNGMCGVDRTNSMCGVSRSNGMCGVTRVNGLCGTEHFNTYQQRRQPTQ